MKKSRRTIIRTGILFFWIFLFIQYWVAKNFREPFPAVVFPSFANVSDEKDTLTFFDDDIILHATDGERLKIEKWELFSELPQPVFIPNVKSNIEARMQNPSFPKAEFNIGLFNFKMMYQFPVDSTKRQGLKQWFKKTIHRYNPDEEIEKIVFYNYQYSFYLRQGQLLDKRKLNNVFTIQLGN